MKYNNVNLTIDEIREEIYNDYIQEYDYLSHEEITELVDEKVNTIFFGENFMNSEDKGEIKTY